MTVPIQLADLLSGLSLATDLASGVPLETSLRTCLLTTHLGAGLGLAGRELRVAFYTGLLRHLGCTAWAHDAAALAGGDDHDLLRTFEGVDSRRLAIVGRTVGRLASGAPLGRRVGAVVRTLASPGAGGRLAAAQCAQAVALAHDLGLDAGVQTALSQLYEQHDGRGMPHALRGAAIVPAARAVHVAQVLEILHRQRGRDAALDEVRRRRGRQLAPEVCDVALADPERLWRVLEAPSVAALALDAEPEPRIGLLPTGLRDVALAFARFVDLKTPHTVGHSPAVAALAAEAARIAGWPDDEIEAVRLAALLHDLGAVSVANGVWERSGPLGATAWEQVRLHAYYTERILARTPALAPLAAIAGAHHERPDGSGYHRGARGEALSRAARLLACADVASAMQESRPHRGAHDDATTARALGEAARTGRLCHDAVAMVLAASGRRPARPALPAGLSEREAEVLGLVARGLSTKEIAAALGIAPRTIKHHIEHVYEKTQVSSRVEAALFAARHDLIAPSQHRPAGR